MRTNAVRPLLVLLALIVAAVVFAACGGGGGDGGGGDRAREVPAERAADDGGARDDANGGEAAGDGQAEAELRVRIEHVGDKSSGAGIPIPTGIACDRKLPATCTEEVRCPAGDARDADVCAWLAREGRELLLGAAPVDEICTEIYGGPEVATVTGTLEGEPVDRTFSRTNGCEINRFDMVAPLWTGEVPPADADGAGGPTGTSGGGAAGACPRHGDPNAPVTPTEPRASGSLADDSACAGRHEPEVISDPPEAFGY